MMLLITGGAGFIGSHFARCAHDAGHRVVVLDNVITTRPGYNFPFGPDVFVDGDITDRDRISYVLRARKPTAIVHFAGEICVSESLSDPVKYFENNFVATLGLLKAVIELPVDQRPVFVFSSTAAVYGAPSYPNRLHEAVPASPINPYGASKLAIEHLLTALERSHGLRSVALRYFNAAGAHPDGSLREDHKPETHLIPLAIDAALGKGPPLTRYGIGDYTRDFVHVMDLAEAHLAALNALSKYEHGLGAINLGTGLGYTVNDAIEAVEKAVRRAVPLIDKPRREGDPHVLVASVDKAALPIEVGGLNWRAKRRLSEIIEDAVRSRR